MPKVLIIDDDKLILSLIQEILKKADFSTLAANNGKEGINVAQTHKPDIIILDNIMPEMDGNEVLKILKENEKTKDIPVIMVTGKDGNDDISTSLKLGASDYVVKPFDHQNIVMRVKRILKQ